MEGVPRIKMIHFPLKEIYDPVDFDVLKKYISDHYDESPADYEQEFTELQNLRKTACSPSHDITGLNAMKRYFSQLQLLRGRFPMEEGEACAISFSWEDVYQKMPVVSADIRFEEMCTLFNIGALHSRLGAREPRADSESMKVACTHFQCAAWAFQRIVDLAGAHVAWTPDCEPSLLRFKSTLMLAQAQECILEKSILDHRKAAITAKVAQQLVDFSVQCLHSLGLETVISVLSSRRHKEWKRMCEMKKNYYQAIAYLSMGESADEGQRYGERLAWFNAAVSSLEEASKSGKELKDESVNETLRFAVDVICGRQANAKKENDLIYTDRVPELHSLPEIRAASLVKGLGFEVSDKEISGPDIFRRLVPMATHAASSVYSEEKAKLLRKLTEEVEEKNAWMDDFLASLSIGSAHPVDCPMSQELLDCCAQLRARTGTMAASDDPEDSQGSRLTAEATGALRKLVDVSVDVESSLAEMENALQEEAQAQEVFAASFPKAGAAPGESELVAIREETAELRTSEKEARNANSALRSALERELKNAQRLMRSPAMIVQELPSVKEITEDETSRKVLLEVARLLGVVEEMRTQRSKLIDQLRQDLLADDITQLLISGSGSAAAAGMEKNESERAELYKEQLKKHDKIVEYLRQNMTAQGNVAKKLEEVYVQYAPIKKRLEELDRSRREEMDELCRTFNAYTIALEKASEGVNFYERTSQSLNRLGARLRRVVTARTRMRETHAAKMAPPPAPAPTSSSNPPSEPSSERELRSTVNLPSTAAAIAAAANDGVPRLKDFLPMMKPQTYGSGSSSTPASSAAASQPKPAPLQQPPVQPPAQAPAQPVPAVDPSQPAPFTVPHQGDFPTAYAQGRPSYSSGRSTTPATSTTGSSAASHPPSMTPNDPSGQAVPQDPNTMMFLPWFQNQQRWCYINTPGQAPVQYSIASQRPTISQTFSSSAAQSTGGTSVSYSVGVSPSSAQQYNPSQVQYPSGQQQPPQVQQQQYQHLYHQPTVQQQSQQYYNYPGQLSDAVRFPYPGQQPSTPSSSYQKPYQQQPLTNPQQQQLPTAQSQFPQTSGQGFPQTQQTMGYGYTPGYPAQQQSPQHQAQQQQQQLPPQSMGQMPQPTPQPHMGYQHNMQRPMLPQQQSQLPAQQNMPPISSQQVLPPNSQQSQPYQQRLPQQPLPQPPQPLQQPLPQHSQLPQSVPSQQPQKPLPQPSFPNQAMPQQPVQHQQSLSQQPQLPFPNQPLPQQQQQPQQSQQPFPKQTFPQQSQPHQSMTQPPQQPHQYQSVPQQPHQPIPPQQVYGYQSSQQQPYQQQQQQPQQQMGSYPRQEMTQQGPPSVNQSQFTAGHPPKSTQSGSHPTSGEASVPMGYGGSSQVNQSSLYYGNAANLQPSGPWLPHMSLANGGAAATATMHNGKPVIPHARKDLLSSSPVLQEATEGHSPDPAAVLTPKVLTRQELEEQHAEETQLRQLAAALESSRKDPLDDNLTLNTFIAEVERFFRRLADLERYDSGELYNAWKKMSDEAKAFPKKSMAIGRMYPMKNRFPEHVPFDENRVILKDAKDDYINATHVDIMMESLSDSACCPKFIVAQAPLPTTLSDFWTMILEQGCEVVAMLACPAVADVPQPVRLPPHWPESKGEVKRFGLFEVLLQAQKEKEWWTERVLTIRRGNGLQTRTVVHLQFHNLLGAGGARGGNPASAEGFASFAAEVRALYKQQRSPIKPIAVLCSSGAGVSGTLVALYAAMLHVETNGRLPNLPNIVLHLWRQRPGLLEDQEQLLLLHRALAHHANDLLVKRNIVVSSGRKSSSGRVTSHSGHSSGGDSLVAGRMPFTDIHSSVSRLTIPDGGAVPEMAGGAAAATAVPAGPPSAVPGPDAPRPVAEPKEKQPTLNELAASLTDLELSPAPTEKRRITKRDFLEARSTSGGSGGLLSGATSTTDPADPFAGIDPMWSLKK